MEVGPKAGSGLIAALSPVLGWPLLLPINHETRGRVETTASHKFWIDATFFPAQSFIAFISPQSCQLYQTSTSPLT
jgi:hypothetical protein